MGLFRNIMEKLGLGKDRDAYGTRPYEQAPGKPATPGPYSAGSSGGGGGGQPGTAGSTGAAAPAAPATPMQQVDVTTQLEAMSAASGQKLNWTNSAPRPIWPTARPR
jgi:hypothetical protein